MVPATHVCVQQQAVHISWQNRQADSKNAMELDEGPDMCSVLPHFLL